MKISLNWLRQYLESSLDLEEISSTLTSIGLEVDGTEPFVSHPGGLEGLVVGQVTRVMPHPNADKLRLTWVDVGQGGEELPIVCGAPNVAEQQKVIVALVGTTLYPKGAEPFTIKKAKIRGEASEGMICAEDEIGVGNSHEGIMVLPEDTPIGTPAATYFGVVKDTQIEIGLTPNRSDAFSHLGVARDLHAALLARGKEATLTLPESVVLPPSNGKGNISVTVHNNEACTRYSGIALSGLTVGPSPAWLTMQLAAIGVRSINNIVDVTNFILHEFGQPLHAFDADQIHGKQIHVRTMPVGTPFVTLDGETRTLSGTDLMICDADHPMCMAGIYGGLGSGVKATTTALFLESATFNPLWIRRSFTAHGLRTDAAVHYEKGTDPNMTLAALNRAVALILEVAGGEVASDLVDLYPKPVQPAPVHLRWKNLNRLIGTIIPESEVRSILKHLGMTINGETSEGLNVLVPTDKTDVLREADLAEEILRIYGMDRIPLPASLRSNIVALQADGKEQGRYRMARFLTGAGYTEVFSNPITRSRYMAQLPADLAAKVVTLANSLNAELDVLRPDLLFGGLESVSRNVNRRQENLRLFEFGKVFLNQGESFDEPEQLGLWMCGNTQAENWRQPATALGYFDLKFAVEQVLQRCALSPDRAESSTHPLLEYGQDYFDEGEKAVSFGRVKGDLTALFDLRLPVFYAAFNWDMLDNSLRNHRTSYQPLSRFPSMRRDLALVLDQRTAFSEVEAIARKRGGKLLREVFLFDSYQGSNLGEGRKSYGIGLSFRDDQATLTDKQVDQVMQNLIKTYETELNATIRR